MTDLAPDTSPYEVLQTIYRDPIFTICRARQVSEGKSVLKEYILSRHKTSPGFSEKLAEAVENLKGITHPNLFPLLDNGVDDSGHYLVYDPGPEPIQPLGLKGPLDQTRAAHICSDIAKAADFLHSQDILLGYQSPEYIFYKADRVVLINYGIKQVINKELSLWWPDILTSMGTGDLAFLPPEEVLGKELTKASDVYALGALYYYLLTGKKPFQGSTQVELGMNIVTQRFACPKHLASRISRASKWFISRSLAKDASDRYLTMRNVRKVLEKMAQGRGMKRASSQT